MSNLYSYTCCSCPHKDERGKVMSLLANILWDFPICFLQFVNCIVVAGSGAKRWSVKPGGKTGSTRSGVSRWRDTNESQVRLRIRCSRQTFFFRHKSAPNLRKRFRLYSISPQPCFFFTKCQMGTNSGNIHMISHDDMMSCPCCILCATYIDMFAAKSINMFKRFHGVNL